MQNKKTAHIISHTHWDREWYLPYEKHHMMLVDLMDVLLETLDNDQEYRSFHLDGQTIILDDYLQVRPDKREALERYIREGRIHIGPWYILQDEFLTSSEANLRNLLVGHQDARTFGSAISKLGYFPDSFGNMGQAPQILQQAGIDAAVFGRGVKPTGFNNVVSEADSFESPYSEMVWRSPDGSEVLGILFANWYSNGNEVPANREEALDYWRKKLDSAGKFASTGHLLFMNGCDHQPIQRDLSEAIRVANELHDDVEFVHSNFDDYVQQVKAELPNDLAVIDGELRSQRTDGWGTLVNTASSRIYLKQMNQTSQSLLEKAAEPLAAYAYMLGEAYPHHKLKYAWKTLMQNHPHDSICGCSVDEVHREMETRFAKSKHVAEAIIDGSATAIADKVDTSRFAAWGDDAAPVVVFNTSGWARSGVVTVEVDVKRVYFREGIGFDEMRRRVKAEPLDGKTLIDADGRPVAYTMEDLGLQFGYDLPDDKFRQPYFTRRVKLTFEAEQVPALGLKTYAFVSAKEAAAPAAASLLADDRTLDNAHLTARIADDGSLSLTDKASGQTYSGLLVYENSGDIGNEYMYKQAHEGTPLTTAGLQAAISVVENTPYRVAVEIVHEWSIPASADELLAEEMQELVWFTNRKAKRSERMVPFTIRTVVSLERNGKAVSVQTSFNNAAKDHRLRALFPTDLTADTHAADSIFEIAKRANTPAQEWLNPDYSHHQQAFVSVSDGKAGLTVANFGLPEYEVLRDGRNTIALTLLRAVGELGDWGLFPTPEAQCLGENTVQFQIIPHRGDVEDSGAYALAYQFQTPWTVKQTAVRAGSLPVEHVALEWNGEAVAFSTLKASEETGDVVARWFNVSREPKQLSFGLKAASAAKVYASNVLEEQLSASAQDGAGRVQSVVDPAKIVSYSLSLK